MSAHCLQCPTSHIQFYFSSTTTLYHPTSPPLAAFSYPSSTALKVSLQFNCLLFSIEFIILNFDLFLVSYLGVFINHLLNHLLVPFPTTTSTSVMSLPVLLPTRDGRFGTKGKPVSVAVNAYRVESFPTVKIYQYDCQIGADATKRTLIQKLWNHPAVQSKFGSARNKVIFDGETSSSTFPFLIFTIIMMIMYLD